MPSTYSPLKIQLMATGENNTTWGDITNLNLGTALEEAIVGSADVTFASADVTLTLTDTNASQTARNMRLRCTGTTGGATRNLIVPSIEKPYIVKNDCANSVVVKTVAGTGITVPAGKTMWVYSDATNVVDGTTHLSSLTLGTDLAVPDGGTGASTFTANGVIYGNTTSALLATTAGTTGQVLVGNTGGAPSWATLTGIGVTSFSGGTTGLTPASATTGAITLGGTLGVANGGTGTTTAFTAGSVVFAGASGVYSQDNANLFWDNANDRLGIGTSSPAAKLDVAGGVNNTGAFRSISGGVDAIFGAAQFASGVVGIGSVSNHPITFNTNLTENMRITTAGNVGIGTTSVSAIFGTTVRIFNAGNGGTLQIGGSAVNAYFFASEGLGVAALGVTTNHPLTFGTNDTERMRITSSGNVGIGTSSPGARFEVSGGQSRVIYASAGFSELQFLTYYSGLFSPVALGQGADGTGYLINRNASGLAFGTSDVERMRITSAGDVGIGTSSPSAKLQVVGSAHFGNAATTDSYVARFFNQNSNLYIGVDNAGGTNTGVPYNTYFLGLNAYPMTFYTNAAERMRIFSGGQVTIGTTSLGISGNANTILSLANGGTDVYTSLKSSSGPELISGATPVECFSGTFTNSPYAIRTNNTERMRIDSSGNVGINTASGAVSTAKLAIGSTTATTSDINLRTTQTDFNITPSNSAAGGVTISTSWVSGGQGPLIFANSSGERMRIDVDGNLLVGTATTNPTNGFVANSNSGNGFYTQTGHPSGTGSGVAYARFMYAQTEIGSITQSGTSNVLYNTSSDVRLKHDIIDAPDASNLIDAMQVRSFKWNVDNSHQRYGFVAQELLEVAPEAVHQPTDPDDMMGVDYSKLVPMLVKEIQSLRARVAQLEGN